jgi:hypothetical protein
LKPKIKEEGGAVEGGEQKQKIQKNKQHNSAAIFIFNLSSKYHLHNHHSKSIFKLTHNHNFHTQNINKQQPIR